eukprot:5152697-Pyramimonas_sp.AAC.1
MAARCLRGPRSPKIKSLASESRAPAHQVGRGPPMNWASSRFVSHAFQNDIFVWTCGVRQRCDGAR